ncbi:hypothetical protein H257_09831 [Aphanomyces astaci]|uniref:Uncharacterized protein n=1 Tax=Aphanomyces astaci TaxID=112090 RepID=W4G988_APHAT|nr:hypothetical protein H257_09831 [Aphanomyces astaci]ETV75856.1 hypothetical protein H257_09831 [Aphanomyces astaci]|eukprot:XP_009834498.1 hypothetical protein H257_09831 [Aphanomyces astaci]
MAVTGGIPRGLVFATGLDQLLTKYVDVFRLTLGRDPPVSMSPLKLHLANEAKPVRFKARRYFLPQHEFMQKHVEEFESAGFTYRTRPVVVMRQLLRLCRACLRQWQMTATQCPGIDLVIMLIKNER